MKPALKCTYCDKAGHTGPPSCPKWQAETMANTLTALVATL